MSDQYDEDGGSSESLDGGGGGCCVLMILLVIVLAALVNNPPNIRLPSWPAISKRSPTLALAELPTQTPALQPPAPNLGIEPTQTRPMRTVEVLVDDFAPQPYQGQPVYFYNRLEGDRGALNDSQLTWGKGQVTAVIPVGKDWGGGWMSLNHPIRERLGINFSAILPRDIKPDYQAMITGLSVIIADGTRNLDFRLELKDSANHLLWSEQVKLTGGRQELQFALPPLGEINQLVWVLDHTQTGDRVTLERLSFQAETPVTDTATAAFVWSYAMLLDNWNPATGLVRDKAKDASGEFDAIQVTGSLAAATAQAEQLGVISKNSAVKIINTICDTLLNRLPRSHGLWPHWVKVEPGGKIVILENTEWSSVDTVIAAIGLIEAQQAMGLDSSAAEQVLREIDWHDLLIEKGISHGYTYSGKRFPYAWDTFGSESWLVELAYASATGQIAPLAYPTPPTANGSGFIDEMAWLFVSPANRPDYWGTDWAAYRASAAGAQVDYYLEHAPESCLAQHGLFGLSAGEVPDSSRVPTQAIYQAFGVGGRFAGTQDGSAVMNAQVAVPHEAALAASLRPQEAVQMWDWLIKAGHFSPLNNVESLMFAPGSGCAGSDLMWNQLKGSWNLALQALGWGRYLAERNGQTPILWQAANSSPLLKEGYARLFPETPGRGATSTPGATASAAAEQAATASLWTYQRECEHPDDSSVGQPLQRSTASGGWVHGQFGAGGTAPWPAQAGYVEYSGFKLPNRGAYILKLRYSKYSSPTAPIQIFVDDETSPRATFTPRDQGDWDRFTWSDALPLGEISGGNHSLKLTTDGQQYGVADLDEFILEASGNESRG